jgi:hypothetical protein
LQLWLWLRDHDGASEKSQQLLATLQQLAHDAGPDAALEVDA